MRPDDFFQHVFSLFNFISIFHLLNFEARQNTVPSVNNRSLTFSSFLLRLLYLYYFKTKIIIVFFTVIFFIEQTNNVNNNIFIIKNKQT